MHQPTRDNEWIVQLKGWPLWSQLHDWTWKDEPDRNAINNCGPEWVCQVFSYCAGVELPADYIKDLILGEYGTGYTNWNQLAWVLRRYGSFPVKIYENLDKEQLLRHIWGHLMMGLPFNGLRFFDTVSKTGGHWSGIVYLDPQYIGESDVWTGSMKYYTYDEYVSDYQGVSIGVHQARYDTIGLPINPR